MDDYILHVEGMSCRSCERLVVDSLTRLDGVGSADASAEENRVVVEGDPSTRERARQAVREAGYDVDT